MPDGFEIIETGNFDASNFTEFYVEELHPCREHGGAHLIKTIEFSRDGNDVKVVQIGKDKYEAYVRHPVENDNGEVVCHPTEEIRGNGFSVMNWLERWLR